MKRRFKAPDVPPLTQDELEAVNQRVREFIDQWPTMTLAQWLALDQSARAFFAGCLTGHLVRRYPERAYRVLQNLFADDGKGVVS